MFLFSLPSIRFMIPPHPNNLLLHPSPPSTFSSLDKCGAETSWSSTTSVSELRGRGSWRCGGTVILGELGLGNLDSQWKPVVCPAFRDRTLKAIACGGAHTLFLTGSLFCYTSAYSVFFGFLLTSVWNEGKRVENEKKSLKFLIGRKVERKKILNFWFHFFFPLSLQPLSMFSFYLFIRLIKLRI